MATHSSVLAWRIPGSGRSGGLPSMELNRVGHRVGSNLAAAAGLLEGNKKMQFLLNALQAPSAKKEDKNKKKYEKDITTATTQNR